MRKKIRSLIAGLLVKLVLHTLLIRRKMANAGGLTHDAFRASIREAFKDFSDEKLKRTLGELQSPRSDVEKAAVEYLAYLGVLDDIIEALKQEISTRPQKEVGNAKSVEQEN